jgi:hypothetical protein
MWRMKIYTVHIKPDGANAAEQPVFVKEGFNIWAFLLTFLWALYHRLWLPALLLLAVNLLLVFLLKHHVFAASSVGVLHLTMHYIAGSYGNDWIRARLTRLGYIMVDVAASDSLLRAEQRYFERYLAAA